MYSNRRKHSFFIHICQMLSINEMKKNNIKLHTPELIEWPDLRMMNERLTYCWLLLLYFNGSNNLARSVHGWRSSAGAKKHKLEEIFRHNLVIIKRSGLAQYFQFNFSVWGELNGIKNAVKSHYVVFFIKSCGKNLISLP